MVEDGAEPKAAANWLLNEYLGRIGKAEGKIEPQYPPVNIPPRVSVTNVTPTGSTTIPSNTRVRVTLGSTDASANSTIVQMVTSKIISGKSAKELLEIVIQIGQGADPDDVERIVEHLDMKQVTDTAAIEKVVDDIVAKNPDKVADAKSNPKAIGWFVGQVMKVSGGKASPQTVNDILKRKLGL
jgi:aspartyl-tRNA(Asn)/glutamyl-tRNA(Gln) amidotransferase subunit B